MTTIEMIRHYLQARGWDGLHYPPMECGCGLDALAPNDCIHDSCQAAYCINGDYIPVVSGEYHCPHCQRSSYPNYGDMCAYCGVRG